MTAAETFLLPISQHIWETKYRYHASDGTLERSIDDTWRRVAKAAASAERQTAPRWERAYHDLLRGFHFVPGGRILAGAGTRMQVTLFNCFVMGQVEDSIEGIFNALKEGALTMQQGGGVGYDFSTLRPRGFRARMTGAIASGPVSFMQIWDAMCGTILSTGARRGAMMATLRCDHPDIEEFVEAKRDKSKLRRFNLSVLVSDVFLDAVAHDRDWALLFPAAGSEESAQEIQMRVWSGSRESVPCVVVRHVRARALWDKIMHAAYDVAEPGVLFVDRINRLNNLAYREHLSATNPCGELPLPAYGACNLGSLNLAAFVHDAFTDKARIELDELAAAARVAVRFLDSIIDVSGYPLAAQRHQAEGSRRIGLGITGLADALIMLGLRYDSAQARQWAATMMASICHSAYQASIALAQEKGPFPFFEAEPYLAGGFVATLPAELRAAIRSKGIRNSHLLAIAPTGTISVLANNVSSGLEPVFADRYQRRILAADGQYRQHEVVDHAARVWQMQRQEPGLPPAFIDAASLQPEAHLAMQAALQPYVDSAISKTINVPEDFPFPAFVHVYERAFALGLKGCTVFRPNPVTGAILSGLDPSSCTRCNVDREAD